jgi:hypothetical protein
MKTFVRTLAASLVIAATAGCNNILQWDNLQGPDIERVLSSGSSIESVISGNYLSCRNNAYGTNAFQQMQTMSFETASSLNNFNMGPVAALPRAPILNNKATQTLGSGTFNTWSSASRNAANAVRALDRLIASGGTIGSAGANARARAFGFFDIACSLGYLALTYDSAAVVTHLMESDEIPPLVGYQDVAAGALAALDSAIAVAGTAAAATGFPTPSNTNAWLSANAITRDQFVQLSRSWKARIRAGVARTKAERDAVNWQAVVSDAEAGITADLIVNAGGNTGWGFGWQGQQSYVEGWQQLTMMILGAADQTGTNWDSWLALPKSNRPRFVLITPDKRWPQGATDVAQEAASPAPANHTSYPYIQNYSANSPLEAWASSNYRWQRFRYYNLGGNAGPVPEFLKAEVDLLAAEGHIRLGNIAAAAAKIDLSRVRAGLPALSGVVTSATQLIPGPNCVPRMVVGPDFNTTTCADIMEAMKYEKRMETGMQRYGAWFFDSRGWQNLYEGTPYQYPVAVDEIDARYQFEAAARYYNVGGGGIYSSPRSLYGFEVR